LKARKINVVYLSLHELEVAITLDAAFHLQSILRAALMKLVADKGSEA